MLAVVSLNILTVYSLFLKTISAVYFRMPLFFLITVLVAVFHNFLQDYRKVFGPVGREQKLIVILAARRFWWNTVVSFPSFPASLGTEPLTTKKCMHPASTKWFFP